MELPSYFADFLSEIRLTSNQVADCQTGHRTLRKRLMEDASLSPIIVSTFLQGSYRRATAVRPKGDQRADVDVVVVTKLDQDEFSPEDAIAIFFAFCEKHYKGKYRVQGRSVGIELSYVDLDLVPTAAPSESERGAYTKSAVIAEDTPETVDDWRLVNSWVPSELRSRYSAEAEMKEARTQPEWKLSPLQIPDREAEEWTPAHPLEQIKWTYSKNKRCNGHYVNVVKAIKWWRRLNPEPKYPKGYPVEHLIGQNCLDGITSVAAGVTGTLEAITSNYRWYVVNGMKPKFPDHGVPEHDVFKRLSPEDFAEFYQLAASAAKLAREALDESNLRESALKWREIFGDKFPLPPDDGGRSTGGFIAPSGPAVVTQGRFA